MKHPQISLKKRGIELSANFLVMMIIAIAVFGIGIKLAFSMFSQAGNTVNNIDSTTKAELDKLLDKNTKVAILSGMQKLKYGQTYTLGIGVKNILNREVEFQAYVVPDKFFKNADSILGDQFYPYTPSMDKEQGYVVGPQVLTSKPKKLNLNQKGYLEVPFKVPNSISTGTYVYDIVVCKDKCEMNCDGGKCEISPVENWYGDKQSFPINVVK